jgi:hypothetical protein
MLSALTPKADIDRRLGNVCLVPTTDDAGCQAELEKGGRFEQLSFRTVLFLPHSSRGRAAILHPMHAGLRRSFIVFIALGLAAGGFARAALAVVPGEPCHLTSHQDMSEHLGHAHHDHAGPPAQHHDHGGSKESGATDAFFKFCGLCIASSNTTGAAQLGQIVFIGLSISYALSGDDYAGRAVPIDPGIPKRDLT